MRSKTEDRETALKLVAFFGCCHCDEDVFGFGFGREKCGKTEHTKAVDRFNHVWVNPAETKSYHNSTGFQEN